MAVGDEHRLRADEVERQAAAAFQSGTALLGKDDPDIGMCDGCGSDQGHRVRTELTRTVARQSVRVVAWLCPPCVGLERN